MKAVIPAAGFGTRFLPATKVQPKEMLPVLNKPVIQYVVEEAVAAGVTDIVIITNSQKQSIESHFNHSEHLENFLNKKGKAELFGQIKKINEMARIKYVTQEEQLGLGHAVLCAREAVGDEPFLVMLGDNIVKSQHAYITDFIKAYEKYNAPIIGLEKIPREKSGIYGVADVEKKENAFVIKSLVEKPEPEEAPLFNGQCLSIMGRYLLVPEIFSLLESQQPGKGDEIQLTDAINRLAQRKEVYGIIADGQRYDTGNVVDWFITNIAFAIDSEYSDEIKSHLARFL